MVSCAFAAVGPAAAPLSGYQHPSFHVGAVPCVSKGSRPKSQLQKVALVGLSLCLQLNALASAIGRCPREAFAGKF